MSLEAKIDGLYSLPLAEFVAARNALAKELRAAGDREAADGVRALAKPNVPAWAVNRLWHGERQDFDRLLRAGVEVRQALGQGGDGRKAATRRREAARGLLAQAKELLSEAGHPATPAVLQKISHTLDAVVALGVDALDPPPGRLSRDLEPPGFDFLAGLQLPAAPKRGGQRAKKKPGKKPPPAKRARGTPRPAKKSAADKRRAERVRAERAALEESRAALATAQEEAERLEATLAAARQAAAETAEAARQAAEVAERAAEKAAAAKDAEKAAAQAARTGRAAARRAATKVKAGEKRLAKLAG